MKNYFCHDRQRREAGNGTTKVHVKMQRLVLLALCAGAALNASTLYSNLGPKASAYTTNDTNPDDSFAVEANGPLFQFWQVDAFEFTVAGTGDFAVTGIDLGVTKLSVPASFTASIWGNSGGSPGAQIAGASWNLTTTVAAGKCCGLTSKTGITGVTLAGGQQYWMVLGPVNSNDGSFNLWMATTVGSAVTGEYSVDGGAAWNSNGFSALPGAFDVIGKAEASTPEPQPLLLLPAGFAAILALRTRARLTATGQPMAVGVLRLQRNCSGCHRLAIS